MLNENDRISLVLFNHSAELLCNLLLLNEDNKAKIKQQINQIKAFGSTNIFQGAELAFKVLTSRKS